jgi:photosystem II stability/assembly factor-like uncharacterized protein
VPSIIGQTPHHRSRRRAPSRGRRTVFLSLLILALFLSIPATSPAQAGDAGAATAAVQDCHLLSAEEGWLLAGGRLYWTKTGGQSWEEITPPDLGPSAISAASFVDTQHGWLLLTGGDGSGSTAYGLVRTSDGGQTWQVTPLALFRPGEPASLAGAVSLQFIDPQTGWLVVKRASSSNFSLGTLFRTTDRGESWTRLPIPLGEPVTFTTGKVGWTAGGAAGDALYRTEDGGRTWQRQTLAKPPAPAGQRRLYQLPSFADPQVGALPVLAGDGGQTQVEFYVTDDGGRSWRLASRVPVAHEIAPGTRVPLSALDARHWLMAIPDGEGLLRLSDRGEITAVASQEHLAAGIGALDMVTPEVGWALSVVGTCPPAPSGERAAADRCRLDRQLLRTEDGGQTWAPLPLPPAGAPSAAPLPAGPGADPSQSPGSRTRTLAGQGFDKCEIASLDQLQNWITSSPYAAVNLYAGGSCRACANSALSAAYLSALSRQGWTFIPTWVGPQSACWGGSCSSRISNDPATAYDQGVAEADAAIAVAVDLGLANADGSGTILYYDLEAYSTSNAACREAAKAFVSGWTARLQEKGSLAAVYGATCASALSDFAAISDVPDAIWPAHWIYSSYNSEATVWDAVCLSNDLWSNQQRIRQYAGGHDEAWGGVTLNIDCDVIDGIVADTASPLYVPLMMRYHRFRSIAQPDAASGAGGGAGPAPGRR